MAKGVELFGIGFRLLVLFRADLEMGEELREQGGVLVLELQVGALLAHLDEADGDELLQVCGEIAIIETQHAAQLGEGDFVLLHEVEQAQAAGIGEGGDKREESGHGIGGMLTAATA